MEISLGSKVTIEIDNKSVEGVVTYLDEKEYVVCYSSDGEWVDFKTVKL